MAEEGCQPEQLDPDVWCNLPRELFVTIVLFLPANEVALTGRLVSKATAAHFHGSQYTNVRLSQPSPPHAFAQRWGSPGAMRGLTLEKRRQLLCLTASSGSLPNLQVAATHTGCVLTARQLKAAAAAGQLEACQWLRHQGCPWGDSLAAAAGAGQQPACEWLLAAGCPWSREAVYAAARGGHAGLMEWLLQRRPKLDNLLYHDLLEAAAQGCNLAVLVHLYRDWLAGEQGKWKKEAILLAAAASPTSDWQDKVLWLEEQGCPKPGIACTRAAESPDTLDRVRWLRQRGYPFDWNQCSEVAWPEVDVLQYLHNNKPSGASDAYPFGGVAYRAAGKGHLAALQWLHAHGAFQEAEDAADVFYSAALHGQLHVLVWLVEEVGLRLSKQSFANAAGSGNFELLRWLRQHGCPWDEGIFGKAAAEGCEEVLEWLVEQGCPMQDDGRPYNPAARNNDLLTLACLRRLGCPWGPPGQVFSECVRRCCATSVLQWMVEQGCPVDWGEAVQSVGYITNNDQQERMLAWLHEQQHQQQH